ncbi:MAG TPA: hypothetical protein DCQ14_00550 [Firmicutes bacterium]|nr:hypothetical protein [Bacillota bacterium]
MNGENNGFISNHSGKIVGGLLGLAMALLFVVFGFWRGLFIIVFVLAGVFIGGHGEIRKEMLQLVHRLWRGRER